MYFSDLSTAAFILEAPYVRAVGWLDADHAFPTGAIEAPIAEKVRAFAALWGASIRALGWPVAMGHHTCELCGVAKASGNFGVPCGDILFVCPQMLAHYIDEHHYLPPPEFIDAITKSAPPDSPEYASAAEPFRALARTAVRGHP